MSMNLILFQPEELNIPLPAGDPRIVHIRTILKAGPGDSLDAGIIGGSRGKAFIRETGEDGSCLFDFTPEGPSSLPGPLTLIIGTPRPPTAKRLLRDLAASGVSRMLFTATDLGEKSYLTSHLWTKEEYLEAVLQGMSQGETTIMPAVEKYYSLYKCIDQLPDETDRLALDNVTPDLPLKQYDPVHSRCCLAVGPERGWSDREREIFRERGFSICSMGERVLRTETAVHAGTALIHAALGYI